LSLFSSAPPGSTPQNDCLFSLFRTVLSGSTPKESCHFLMCSFRCHRAARLWNAVLLALFVHYSAIEQHATGLLSFWICSVRCRQTKHHRTAVLLALFSTVTTGSTPQDGHPFGSVQYCAVGQHANGQLAFCLCSLPLGSTPLDNCPFGSVQYVAAGLHATGQLSFWLCSVLCCWVVHHRTATLLGQVSTVPSGRTPQNRCHFGSVQYGSVGPHATGRLSFWLCSVGRCRAAHHRTTVLFALFSTVTTGSTPQDGSPFGSVQYGALWW
jgi:hypothetical protein